MNLHRGSSTGSPTVTVLIPTYNAAAFIGETIASVLAQTYPDFELVVVDDGSTDGTVEAIEEIGDPRIRLMQQSNGGPACALNAAIPVVRGRFIAFLDHDDLWTPTKLARHIESFERNADVDLTYSWTRYMNASGKLLALHSRRAIGRVGFRELVADYVIGPTSSVVLRRSALDHTGMFDTAFLRYYDMDLFLRIARVRSGNIETIPEELTLYRRHAGQMSSDWRGLKREWELFLGKLRRLAPEQTEAAAATGDANMHRYFAYLAYEIRDYRNAVELLGYVARHSQRRGFLDLRNLKLALASAGALVLPRLLYSRLEELAGLR